MHNEVLIINGEAATIRFTIHYSLFFKGSDDKADEADDEGTDDS